MYAILDDAEVHSLKIAGLAPPAVSPAVILEDKTLSFQDATTFRDLISAEPKLSVPTTSGWVLSSTDAGVKSWVAPNAHSHTLADVVGLATSLATLQTQIDQKLSTVTADATSRAANTVYAGPDGSAGAAAFRALVANDIPSLNTSKLTSGILSTSRGGTAKGSWSQFDVPFLSTATAFGAVAANTTTSIKSLVMTGTGSVGAAPAWASVVTSVAGTTVLAANTTATTGAVALAWAGSASNLVAADGSTVAVSSLAAAAHTHPIADVTGLQTALDARLTTVTGDATSRTANAVYAAPNGAAGTATFRALVAADLPTSGVTAGSYGAAANTLTATVDTYGRVTAMAATAIAIAATQLTSGTLGTARGGTGATTWSQWAVPYLSTATAMSGLAPNTTTSIKALVMTGTGSAGAAPAWSSVLTSITGTTVLAANTTATTGAVALAWAGSASNLVAADGSTVAVSSLAAAAHTHTLDGLSDVTITSVASGEVVRWNGAAWVNNTLAEAGIQPAGAYLTGNQTITLSGIVTGSGTTAITTSITDGALSFAKTGGLQAFYNGANWGNSFESPDPFTSRSSYAGQGGVRTAYGAGPSGTAWYNMVDVRHYNTWSAGVVYGGELVWGMTNYINKMSFRSRASDGAPQAWYEVAVQGNAVLFDSVITSNNGAGQNVRIGDDLWIGDINKGATAQLSGANTDNATSAFLKFGTSGPTLGYDGTTFGISGSTGTSVGITFKTGSMDSGTAKGRVTALINDQGTGQADLVLYNYNGTTLAEAMRLRGYDNSAWFYGLVAPATGISYDLGSSGNRWNNLFVDGIQLGDVSKLTHNGTSVFAVSSDTTLPAPTTIGTMLFLYADSAPSASIYITAPSGYTLIYRSSGTTTVSADTLVFNNRGAIAIAVPRYNASNAWFIIF